MAQAANLLCRKPGDKSALNETTNYILKISYTWLLSKKRLFKYRCEREGDQSLSDFVIGMRKCGRNHLTEEQSRKRQRVTGEMVFFLNILNSLNVFLKLASVLHLSSVFYPLSRSRTSSTLPRRQDKIHLKICNPWFNFSYKTPFQNVMSMPTEYWRTVG